MRVVSYKRSISDSFPVYNLLFILLELFVDTQKIKEGCQITYVLVKQQSEIALQ